MDDAALLQRFVAERAEDAFAQLVERHVGLVHAVATRCLYGDEHLARDVTQAVFCDLARRAATLPAEVRLAGWLFAAARFEAAKQLRGRARRRAREATFYAMNEITKDDGDAVDWDRVRPVLDEALGDLPEDDREAVLLRFFEGRDYAAIGASLRVRDDAARMRVARALDTLQAALKRRGVTSTVAALGATLSAQAMSAAPVGLAASVTTAALGAGAAAGAGTAAGLVFMGMTKLQVVAVGAILVAGAAGTAWRASEPIEPRQASAPQPVLESPQLVAVNQSPASARSEPVSPPAADPERVRLESEAATLRREAASLAAGTAAIVGKIWNVRQLDKVPAARFRARPDYPQALRNQGVTGQATIEFIVSADGAVNEAKVVTATHPEFGDAALAAVKLWQFDAGQVAGAPVNARMQMPIVFSIGDPIKPESWF